MQNLQLPRLRLQVRHSDSRDKRTIRGLPISSPQLVPKIHELRAHSPHPPEIPAPSPGQTNLAHPGAPVRKEAETSVYQEDSEEDIPVHSALPVGVRVRRYK
jgi:hypothetical protein